jgi:hypothetical protein
MLMTEGLPTVMHPAFVLNNIIYLPVYHRPILKFFWVAPNNEKYTTNELIEAGAHLIMLDLWERIWLKDMVKIQPNSTLGEIKMAYQKMLGVL